MCFLYWYIWCTGHSSMARFSRYFISASFTGFLHSISCCLISGSRAPVCQAAGPLPTKFPLSLIMSLPLLSPSNPNFRPSFFDHLWSLVTVAIIHFGRLVSTRRALWESIPAPRLIGYSVSWEIYKKIDKCSHRVILKKKSLLYADLVQNRMGSPGSYFQCSSKINNEHPDWQVTSSWRNDDTSTACFSAIK